MKRNSQSGQALVFAALGMLCLLGFVGLGVDMGLLRYDRRIQQTAADAAAIAGAQNLAWSGWQAGGQDASARNGFTDVSGNTLATCANAKTAIGTVCVQISNPPTTGPHASGANSTKYVEAYVSVVQPTYFMKIFGIDRRQVTARAVATNLPGGGGGAGCLYTLGLPSASIEGVNIQGSAVLNASNCGIVDNGNFNTIGNKIDVTAYSFGVYGSKTGTGGGTVTCVTPPKPCPVTEISAATDPVANLSPPIPPPCSPCSVGTSIKINGTQITGTGAASVSYNSATTTFTIQPGSYSGIDLSGVQKGSTINFAPGTYIIDGTNGCNAGCVSIPGNAIVTGTNVFFYFTNNATWQTNGTASINLSASSTGTYAGMLFWQDKNDTNIGPNPNGPTLGGNNTSNYAGVLYFPSDQITFYGDNKTTGTGVQFGTVISDSVAIQGNPTVVLNGPKGIPGGGTNFTLNAVLVE
jgi:hypothetical protein